MYCVSWEFGIKYIVFQLSLSKLLQLGCIPILRLIAQSFWIYTPFCWTMGLNLFDIKAFKDIYYSLSTCCNTWSNTNGRTIYNIVIIFCHKYQEHLYPMIIEISSNLWYIIQYLQSSINLSRSLIRLRSRRKIHVFTQF